MSAVLENADVFRTAKTNGTVPKEPAKLVLRRPPDFDKKDFDRKAKDLQRLSQQGKLKKAKSERPRIRDQKSGEMRTKSQIYRERMIRKLERKMRQGHDVKQPLWRLYAGKGNVGPGKGLDPDHIHELQLDGPDEYYNLRLKDTYTNRMMGSDISTALRNVPEGHPVTIRVIP
ncbi:hypothetical protein GA0074695_5223 [Micromonospora viridifaciens]|uniref:Uncharacterized protein n=1 Tax=Micromonospora viridifaciens TaxID=1881 RepID=A0A1C4Z866_MICVI|nr:hypothetical protein [Micromonospora viridifaciens]SCF29138.1 hypothetical protein GA0074695_5223 [Micromonospora viridifaciens]